MDELISKRAVIEAIEKARANVGHNLERSIGKSIIEILDEVGRDVDRLPSVLGTNLAEVGTDLISRQAAIDALRNYLVGKNVPCDGTLTCRLIENEVINKLPSAQPEIIRCKDCDWWTKQEDSPQGRCALLQMYPTGGWFCGNARRREATA